MVDRPLIKFDAKLPLLSRNEREVLDLLIEAGELIVPLYQLQENNSQPGANFYPKGVSKAEIEEAAKKDPAILSPYTVVEKVNGKLTAIPYHEKYADLLKPIINKLLKAAELTENKDFAKRLKLQAKILTSDNFEEEAIHLIEMKYYVLHIVIGPIERYNDKLFFVKTSYQAWVGVIDKVSTETATKYKDVVLSARRKAVMPTQKVDYYDKVLVKVLNVKLLSGLAARTMFVGVNLPNDIKLMEKYGALIVLFNQVNDHRVKHQILPAFNSAFSSAFRKTFSYEDIRKGSLDLLLFRELAHTYLRYRNSVKNLGDLYPIIDELGAYVMGMRVCGSLLLKDIISTKDLESIIIAFISRNISLTQLSKNDKTLLHYKIGGEIFLNYLTESGAIVHSQGMSIPNFMKIFVSINELASILEDLLSAGTRKDTELFIKRYSKLEKLS